ncbi:MAG: glycosyltransferase [Pseudomonadota bacterium]
MSANAPAPSAGSPTISVIVPAYNAAHYLALSLPPLIRMRERGEVAEVLVVDDCSPDPGNIEMAERLGATIIRMKQNGGPGAARNHAAKLATGDILWLVDADVVAHETGAALIREAFGDPQVSAVFGSYDRNPPAKNFASQYKNLVHRYYHQRGKEESDTFWSGCGAIRKSVYLDLGGFDGARYGRPSIEDIEFGFRMRKAGWKIRLVPELLGTHLKRWKLSEVVRTDIFQRAVPWSHLILSGRGMNNDLNVSSKERLKAGVAGLWVLGLLASLVPPLWPAAPTAAVMLTAGVGLLNADLAGFFRGNRGLRFALIATAYHQAYYIYSAATFSLCALAYHLGGRKEVIVRRVGDRKQAV